MQPSSKEASTSSKEGGTKEKSRGKDRHKDKSAKEEAPPSAAATASVVSLAPVSAAMTAEKDVVDTVTHPVEELHTNIMAKGYAPARICEVGLRV